MITRPLVAFEAAHRSEPGLEAAVVGSDLQAPVMSIGGAGTFDAIFVTGVPAVLLAGL
jgi:Protein of unknown function (DUF1614)